MYDGVYVKLDIVSLFTKPSVFDPLPFPCRKVQRMRDTNVTKRFTFPHALHN